VRTRELGETVDSRMLLGSSPERSFWHRNNLFVRFLTREAKKRETGSIESEGDLRGGSGWSRAGIGDSENLRFSPKSRVSHFHLNGHLSE